jgi:hypothetical protein
LAGSEGDFLLVSPAERNQKGNQKLLILYSSEDSAKAIELLKQFQNDVLFVVNKLFVKVDIHARKLMRSERTLAGPSAAAASLTS